MREQTPAITIVVPLFNEEKNIPRLYERLAAVVLPLDGYRWSFCFVNDGSSDNSWSAVSALAAADARVKAIDLSRNFGKEVALTAGVQASADADAVICIDADLQHPPELIPELVKRWREGAEVVATVRRSLVRQPLLRRLASHGYYWVMGKISGLDMRSQTTDFRLFDRKVVAAFCTATERNRMFRGIMDWLGFRKVYVEFDASAREEGNARYSYSKLWRLAIDSMTSFSLFPLRITGYLGVLISVASTFLLFWMSVVRFALGDRNMFSPLAFVVVANTLLIGVVLMAVGLVALYIGQIHTEVINRPLYAVRDTLNLSKKISERCD